VPSCRIQTKAMTPSRLRFTAPKGFKYLAGADLSKKN